MATDQKNLLKIPKIYLGSDVKINGGDFEFFFADDFSESI